ncbi:MAG TPA: 4a-hydroxytetrahydrobiopterin dehydratase [Bacteroidota bacterium]|nr:4a-hydroxytetrahydrobiopterin dehydratase [Bacteroidota bacterium]
MPERRKLAEPQIASALKELPGWSLREGKLHRELKFGDFVEAFSFMAGAALVAESLNHHPEWSNVYNRVTIDLSTHSEGGVTGFDVEWAKRVEGLL